MVQGWGVTFILRRYGASIGQPCRSRRHPIKQLVSKYNYESKGRGPPVSDEVFRWRDKERERETWGETGKTVGAAKYVGQNNRPLA